MAAITDVSPTRSNMSFGPDWRDVTGRMLSLASSDDGSSSSPGRSRAASGCPRTAASPGSQLAWAQPARRSVRRAGRARWMLHSVGRGWAGIRALVRSSAIPRFLADITGDGRADIVGFGDTGVWTALGNGDGTFQPPRVAAGRLRLRGRRVAGRPASAVPRRHHRRRSGRHRRLRRRRRLDAR